MIRDCYRGIDIVLTPKKITYKTKSGVAEKEICLTKEEVRRQLSEIKFTCPYNRYTKDEYFSEDVESHGMPYMNFIYYYELYKLGRIPTFKEFYTSYLRVYCDKLPDGMYTVKPFFDSSDFKFTEKQLMGRVFRSYNSFHREVDFLYQMASYEDVTIQYSLEDDLDGIDFIVHYKGKVFGLASYISSQKSFDWKKVKNNNRHDYSNIEMIDVVANISRDEPNNCDCIKGIYVYSPSYVASKYFEIKKRYEESAKKTA